MTCGSIGDKDKNGIGAGLYGHEEQDAARYFLQWGFDFIKIDYCGARQELDLEEQQRYTAIRQAFNKNSRPYFSLQPVTHTQKWLILQKIQRTQDLTRGW